MTGKGSESVEMYLKSIATLRENGSQAVPLSLLAGYLSILPTSANEMCRKLAADGLVEYRPYKGVTLTPAGEEMAQRVLCRQRLWECFLVDKLGFTADDAEEAACQLEHATSDQVVDGLASFLGYPARSPRNEPIPCPFGAKPAPQVVLLSTLDAGQTARVSDVTAQDVIRDVLRSQGLSPGVFVHVVAVKANESIVLLVGDNYLSLAFEMADHVNVVPAGSERWPDTADRPQLRSPLEDSDSTRYIQKEKNMASQVSQLTLDRLPMGAQGVIVRLGGGKATKQRMLDMGLVTGETITLKAAAPMGDPLEFFVKGYQLSMRKSEARNVIVEVMGNPDTE